MKTSFLLFTLCSFYLFLFFGCGKLLKKNDPPVILSISAESSYNVLDNKIKLTCNARDSDGDSLSYSWVSPSCGTLSSTSGETVYWSPPSSAYATCVVTCTASDGKASTSANKTIYVNW